MTNLNVIEGISIELPNDVRFILDTLKKNGYEAFAVGGCIRDSILGLKPKDWDITTSALPGQIKGFFKRTIDTGIEHGTVTVMLDKTAYEVTTYRVDGKYSDGRHPDKVEFAVNLKEDLSRRDFTINALAYNPEIGLVDEFDGLSDLKQGIIRAVGDPKLRFNEDALRMMRAIRFSAQLGFDIDNATFAAIIELSKNINHVSMERIHTELGKTLMTNYPEYCLSYATTGLFMDILPIVQDALTNNQSQKVLSMLKAAPMDLSIKYAALFCTKTADEATATLRVLKMDNKTINMVDKILKASKLNIPETEPGMRETLHKIGVETMDKLISYMEADLVSNGELLGIVNPSKKKHLFNVKRLYNDIISNGDCFAIADLDIDGNDLKEYGLSGVEIGETLEKLLAIVMENPRLNDKAVLIGLVEHL